ncbi:hypothetical protein AGMMS49938_09770 [Fibrobacterales bacterium]|nr:hypothetical protein AGMMS49938_09770 [Fibrobacterales bacterium]
MLKFFLAAFSWAAVAFVINIFSACSGGGGSEHPNENGGDGAIRIFFGKIQVPLFDSVSIKISASDIDTIRNSYNSLKDNIRIDGIPLGEARKFEIKVYADVGKLVQSGNATADIFAGEVPTIPITLNALAGFLRMEIPLGLPNNTEVTNGELFLDTMAFQMTIENGKGIFTTGALPLNKNFSLVVLLKNSQGEVLFSGEQNLTLSSILQNETIKMISSRGSAVLEISANTDKPTQILAVLPTAIYREPENYGDVFFTEIFAYPKTGEEPFKYMEIYNATLDTLNLTNCRVATNRTTTATSLSLPFPENSEIQPMSYLLLGRDSVKNADIYYQNFNLVSTKQSLGLFCGNIAIDSIFYNKSDSLGNAFPMVQNFAMQLPLSNFLNRNLGISWCAGNSPKEDGWCE